MNSHTENQHLSIDNKIITHKNMQYVKSAIPNDI